MFVIYILLGCESKQTKLENALQLAGKNREDLEKAISHYKKDDKDTLKLKSVLFLIENMPGKGYIPYRAVNEKLQEIDFDIFQYRVYDSMLVAKDQFEQEIGSKINYIPSEMMWDIQHISSDYLIENIEYAFKVWQFPWAKHLSFEQFCEYILPYRVGEEPLQAWRKEFYEKNQWIINKAQEEKDLVKLVSIVNDSIKKCYEWRHKETEGFYDGALSLKQINLIKGGRCNDLNVITAYWLRAVGIPIASENTPFLSNRNMGGHSWLSVLDKNQKFIPFNSAYDNPRRDSLPFGDSRIAKCFRNLYAYQKSELLEIEKDVKLLPPIFRNLNQIDNTNELVTTQNVTVNLSQNINKANVAYVAILNGEDWRILHWGKVIRQQVTFTNLGLEAFYLPFFYKDGQMIPASDIFFLDKEGKVKTLKPNEKERIEIGIHIAKDLWWLRKDRKYELVYWEGKKWSVIGEPSYWAENRWTSNNSAFDASDRRKKISNDSTSFMNVPDNALLRFRNQSEIRDIGTFSRPFMFIDKKYLVY
jgi:hypothetical protein